MEPVVLRRLREDDEAVFVRAIASWPRDEATTFAPNFDPAAGVGEYVRLLDAQARGERLPDGWVPSITMFGFAGDEVVGRLQFRRVLNERLLLIGGNIGYAVLPQFRGRGYAKSMLRQGLTLACAEGLRRVLITCDEDNRASARIIESVGGKLENVVSTGEATPRKARYWVSLECEEGG
ncbi:MAG: GNAT family N-acetyltransferase [Acidobacteria bacterium]|nr:MAG: GNAT family N-acetyltransferase [Acidobacteriota bacterium]